MPLFESKRADPGEGQAGAIRAWEQVPLAVRSVVVGFAVLVAGNFLPQGLIAANFRSPALPWSAFVVAVYLWLYWQHLKGRGWPRFNAEARRRGLRAVALAPTVWRWSLLAGALGIAALMTLTYALSYLMPLGLGTFPDVLLRLPPPTAVAIVVTVSAMAGVVEEAAFRGYMQGPIEKRHGPGFAISLVSIVFTLAHLPGSVAAAPRMALILIASVGYGVLAHLTGSILPGMVLHIAQDVLGSALLWLSTRGVSASSPPPALEARGPTLWLECAATLAFAAASAWAFARLRAAVKRSEPPNPG